MTPLIITGAELAFKFIEMAIAAGELTPDEVIARIKSSQAAADAAEKRVDDRLSQ